MIMTDFFRFADGIVTIEDIEALENYLGIKFFDDAYASEPDEEAFDREWNRERQREARPRERDRARARYKAHCIRMTAQKARQHLRRRKYRSGANAGVW